MSAAAEGTRLTAAREDQAAIVSAHEKAAATNAVAEGNATAVRAAAEENQMVQKRH